MDREHGQEPWFRRGVDLGPQAIVALAIGLGVLDGVTALHRYLSPLLLAAQTVLFVPWAVLVLKPAPRRGRAGTEEGPRRRYSRAGVAAAAIVAVCTASKWVVLAWSARDGGYVDPYRIYTACGTAMAVLGLLGRERRIRRMVFAAADQPARLMLLSFGGTALFGAFVLSLPGSLRRVDEASFVDALFMATSAVCVTGLAVHDVAGTYTPFGQAVILLLIQAGGLGIMVLSTFFVILAGRRLRLRSTAVLAEAIDAESVASLRHAILSIVLYTLALEAVGALLLYAAFSGYPEVAWGPMGHPLSGPGGHAWAAVFHAVSAFCNAGLTLFPLGLAPFTGDALVGLTVMALVTLGGFGFPVLSEVTRRARQRLRGERPPRLSLHSRTVFYASAFLTVSLAVMVMGLEWTSGFSHLPPADRLAAALFHSVSARTAGFNTVDIGAMRPATWLLLCLVMFVGASPGSTGGGLKTTTVATLFATVRSVVTGEPRPRLLDRTVPGAVVARAIGVTFLSSLLLAGFVFVLLLTERHAPLQVLFEAVSAFATVGYSTGITPDLSPAGRLILVATMLVGRIGPLTMTVAFAGRHQARAVEPAEERLLIG